MNPSPKCECDGMVDAGTDGSFWCERHQCRKTSHYHLLCQTRPLYRALWDSWHGPGQAKTGHRRSDSFARDRSDVDVYRSICLLCQRFTGTRCSLSTGGCEESRRNLWTHWLRRGKCPDGKWGDARSLTRWISNVQRIVDIATLATMVPPEVTAVAGVPRSGLTPALIIAERLHLWPYVIHPDMGLQPLPVGWRMKAARPDSGTLLVVDDTIGSGRAMRDIIPLIPQDRPTLKAVVYCNPTRRSMVDFCALELPLPHYLEWCFANSPYTRTLAFDMDGVICQQNVFSDDDERYGQWLTDAPPLHVPRQFPTPAIVTYRCQCHRAATEHWLQRWGCRYDQLIMAPFDDWRERDARLSQQEHKAKYLNNSQCVGLVESDDFVARKVHSLTGKLVIALDTGRIYA